MSKNNNSKNNKTKNNKNNKIKKNNINNTTDNFADTTPSESESASTYEDVITFLSVSPSAGTNPTTFSDKLKDYFILLFKYGFLVVLLTVNFLGLSVSLNCNADQEYSLRIFSAIFAFFFGFVYLIVNYYTYKVLGEGKICKMNKDKLFPFKK